MKNLASTLLLVATAVPTLSARSSGPTAADWRADLRTIVRTIDSVHPWPWRRISADSFHRLARWLHTAIPSLSEDRFVTLMMALVASLRDGHTTLFPTGRAGFDRWFPVRLFRFSDSVVVVAADSDHADLPGARVVRIGIRGCPRGRGSSGRFDWRGQRVGRAPAHRPALECGGHAITLAAAAMDEPQQTAVIVNLQGFVFGGWFGLGLDYCLWVGAFVLIGIAVHPGEVWTKA
jgi:hypothetical protein